MNTVNPCLCPYLWMVFAVNEHNAPYGHNHMNMDDVWINTRLLINLQKQPCSLTGLVAYAGPVRPAAALRDSVLCLPTDIHSLFVNKPSSSSSSSFSLCPPPPPPALTMFGRAGVEDYQHVERSCIPFARTRTFPLTRWRVRQKVSTRRA